MLSELGSACALLWLLGLAFAIILGAGRAYIHGTARLSWAPIRLGVRQAKHWLRAALASLARVLGRRIREW